MRVLVLTLSFGSGHVRAAQTVAHELSRQAPGSRVLVVDALDECRAFFRAFYEWPYWLMLRYAPALWDRFSTARVNQNHQGTAPAWAFRIGCPKVFMTIRSFKPEVIVAAEVAACEMAVIARRMGMTQAPILSVITDYEAEPIWVKPEVDAYAVPDENVRAELIAWGAIANRISVPGIPVDEAFDKVQYPPRTIRGLQGNNNETPIVLLMGGGMGPTRMDEIARRLAEHKVPMHIVAIAGKDKRAHRKLKSLKVEPPVLLSILSWTEDVAALMQAATILVTKPGGLTIAEAALCSLPTIFFNPIPGAEFVNAKRMVDAGAGVLTKNSNQTAKSIVSLLGNEKKLHAMALAAKEMARPSARSEIAQLALKLAMPATAKARRMTA